MEGPSLVILKEEAIIFKGRKVIAVNGYAKVDHDRLLHQKLLDIQTWGKHFLLCFKDFTVRVHFLLFGSYRISNSKQGSNASLGLVFDNGELDCYVCSVKIIEEKLDTVYDWSLDMLSPKWDPKKVRKILNNYSPDLLVGDVLLDANLFSGVGNIIRNEVLYRVLLHPDSVLRAIPSKKITAMIKETQVYSLDFLTWKKSNELKKHWEVYTKTNAPKVTRSLKHIQAKRSAEVLYANNAW